jgi:putative flippase GtrA
VTESRPLRFVLAGAANTAFGFGVYGALALTGLATWLCLLLGTLAGIAFNFVTWGAYVFRDLTIARLPSFLSAYGFVYAANLGLLHLLLPWTHNRIWTQLFLVPAMAVLSYLLMNGLVFRGNRAGR